MTRLCERPGCSVRAELLYGIDAERLTVWIESIDQAANVRAGVLCRRHADAMVVPLGWMLDDQREPVPQLFKAPAISPPQAAARSKRPRVVRSEVQEPQLPLGDGAVPTEHDDADAVDAAASHLEQHEVQPWVPIFDDADDLDGLLGARGPLLSRAFRGTDRPHRGE